MDLEFVGKILLPEQKFMKKLQKPMLNKQTAEQAVNIWFNYQGFDEHLMSLPKTKHSKHNKCYECLGSVVCDPLLSGKFKFVEIRSWKF